MVYEWYDHKKPPVYTEFKFQYSCRNVKFSEHWSQIQLSSTILQMLMNNKFYFEKFDEWCSQVEFGSGLKQSLMVKI